MIPFMELSFICMGNLDQAKENCKTCVKKAVIDVGTNSVKLLVAQIADHHIIPIRECAIQTRLGNNAFNNKILQNDGIERTVEVIEFFHEYSKTLGANNIVVIGTSAVREAVNRDEIVKKVKEKTGADLRIISGEEEAELAYYGVVFDTSFENAPVLITEVGGGSSQFIIGDKLNLVFRKSYKIGGVRLMNMFPVSDPPTRDEFLKCKAAVEKEIRENVYPDVCELLADYGNSLKFVATGGTITIVGKMKLKMDEYNREKLDGLPIKLEEICGLTEQLWGMTLKERQSLPGLPADRADVILFGLQIFMGIMSVLKLNTVHLSARGLRFGALKKF